MEYDTACDGYYIVHPLFLEGRPCVVLILSLVLQLPYKGVQLLQRLVRYALEIRSIFLSGN